MDLLLVKNYVKEQKDLLREQISSLKVKPCFVIVQVNDDPASNSYIKGKMKDANEVGINCILEKYNKDITEEELIEKINKINNNPEVHGLIVQMPLPKHISEDRIKLAVNPKKDIDGFHPLSSMDPCTPKGIINLLKYLQIQLVGKNAVVIGRSNIVGKPMGKLLLKESCNVTTLHSKTTKEDMAFYIKHADIIVVAVGVPHFLNKSFEYKKDAVIVDVGINRVDDYLLGDAENDLPVKYQTPVPGGVGLLTRLNLLINLMEAYNNEI